jgi:putative transposase
LVIAWAAKPSPRSQDSGEAEYYPGLVPQACRQQVRWLESPSRPRQTYAERWVRSVKEECLSKVILLGECSLRRALNEYVEHYHAERNHQGKGNVLLFPRDTDIRREPQLVQCRERLGGLLRYYHQEAA